MEDRIFDQHMQRILLGDKDALHEIYIEYGPYIYHQILNIVQVKEDAEDVTSEFFIKLWKNADKYKPGGGHKAYILTMARNMALDFLRAHKKEVLLNDIFPQKSDSDNVYNNEELLTDPGGGAVLGGGGGGGPSAEESDTTANTVISDLSMKEALEKLKPPEREVIHLKIAMELTFEEISKILNVPMGTVTWRYREAINKLRRCGFGSQS